MLWHDFEMPAVTIAALLVLWQADPTEPRWELQSSGTSARLRGVSAVNDRVAWASGAAGTIVRTGDGGRTWQRLSIPGTAALDFRDIDALDENNAYVLSIGPGEASRIYRTRDGGVTWQLQFTNPDPRAFYDALTAWSRTRALAFSDSVDGRLVMRITRDGGDSWMPVPADRLPTALPGEGAFAASGSNIAAHGRRLWIGTGAGRVLRSADEGQSWQAAVTGLASSPTAGIFSIAFRDGRHGIVVGGDYKRESVAEANAAVSSDGGKSWRLVGSLSGFRSAVAWLEGQMVLAIGPTGTDLSRDDGQSWRQLSGEGFHAFSKAPGIRAAWAVGEAGKVARLRW